jgi:hypothetical protein
MAIKWKYSTITIMPYLVSAILTMMFILQKRFILLVIPSVTLTVILLFLHLIGQAMVLVFHYLKKSVKSQKCLILLKVIVFLIPGILIYGLFAYITAATYNMPYTWLLLTTSLYSLPCYAIGVISMTMIKLKAQKEKYLER